jgi:hypothetical protein
MSSAYNLPVSISRTVAFCIKIVMITTKRSVITILIVLIVTHVSNNFQNWKGRFGGPFILQVFATHLAAIDGFVDVPDLHDYPSPNAIGALALVATSVCT